MGWPVQMDSHVGYRGNLTPSISDVAPYYSDLYNEVIFHSPGLCRCDGTLSRRGSKIELAHTFSHAHSNSVDSISPSTNLSSIDFATPDIFERHEKRRHRSYTAGSPMKRPIFHKVIHEDAIAILWIQDKQKMSNILENMPSHFQVIIMVYPMPICLGMYSIRIFTNGAHLEDQHVPFR